MAGRLVAPPACSALTVGPVCRRRRACCGAATVGAEPSVTLCRRPSFDDVQDLGGARKFFPAHEFMRQALYPLEIGGNYLSTLGGEQSVTIVSEGGLNRLISSRVIRKGNEHLREQLCC